jgi:hypothetical protein
MNKKIFSVALAALLFALRVSAQAQQPRRVARIGYLDNGTAADSAELLDAFRKQMTQLDWIEGKNRESVLLQVYWNYLGLPL